MTDYELVQMCLTGDKECFAELVGRYKNLVYSMVGRYTANAEEKNDLSQEVFIKVYKSIGSYDEQYKFSTWIMTIARNTAIDSLRMKKINTVSIDKVIDMSASENMPEKRILSHERGAEINKAIEKLPESYKQLVVLYHKKGATYNEMADILGKPISIVKNRLHRARLMLRERLTGINEVV